jgi:hypothetical protein
MLELLSLKRLRHSLSSLPGLDRSYIIELRALKRWAIIDRRKPG